MKINRKKFLHLYPQHVCYRVIQPVMPESDTDFYFKECNSYIWLRELIYDGNQLAHCYPSYEEAQAQAYQTKHRMLTYMCNSIPDNIFFMASKFWQQYQKYLKKCLVTRETWGTILDEIADYMIIPDFIPSMGMQFPVVEVRTNPATILSTLRVARDGHFHQSAVEHDDGNRCVVLNYEFAYGPSSTIVATGGGGGGAKIPSDSKAVHKVKFSDPHWNASGDDSTRHTTIKVASPHPHEHVVPGGCDYLFLDPAVKPKTIDRFIADIRSKGFGK